MLIMEVVTGDLSALSPSLMDREGFFELKAGWCKSQESENVYNKSRVE